MLERGVLGEFRISGLRISAFFRISAFGFRIYSPLGLIQLILPERGELCSLCLVPKAWLFIKYWLPVLVWMGLIFSASSDGMSFQHSSRIIGPMLHWLLPQLSAEAVHGVVVFVRKCAHLMEYAILALLLWRALRKPAPDGPGAWQWPEAGRATLLVMLYAASDEFHQLFVPSRQASVVDVLIDTSGAVLALSFVWGIGRWRRRW